MRKLRLLNDAELKSTVGGEEEKCVKAGETIGCSVFVGVTEYCLTHEIKCGDGFTIQCNWITSYKTNCLAGFSSESK